MIRIRHGDGVGRGILRLFRRSDTCGIGKHQRFAVVKIILPLLFVVFQRIAAAAARDMEGDAPRIRRWLRRYVGAPIRHILIAEIDGHARLSLICVGSIAIIDIPAISLVESGGVMFHLKEGKALWEPILQVA